MDTETPYWFALTFESGLGYADVHDLIRFWRGEEKRSLAVLFELDRPSWESAGLNCKQQEALARAKDSLADVQKELEPCRIARIAVLTARHPDYPRNLEATLGRVCPPLLFCAGNPELLKRPSVSVIGARRASQPALEFTLETVEALARAGVTIVTAHEDGINRCALAAALESGGNAILFLAQGVLTLVHTEDNLGACVDQGRLLVVSACRPRDLVQAERVTQCYALVTAVSRETIMSEIGSSDETWEAARTALQQKKRFWIRQDDDSAGGRAALSDLGAHFLPGPGEKHEEWLTLVRRTLQSCQEMAVAFGIQLPRQSPAHAPLFPEIEDRAGPPIAAGSAGGPPKPRLSEDVRRDVCEFISETTRFGSKKEAS